MTLTESDKQALSDLLEKKHVRSFLERFCAERVTELNEQCARAMRPMANVEDAKAYACQAQVYERFVAELEELERRK